MAAFTRKTGKIAVDDNAADAYFVWDWANKHLSRTPL
jgi:hypothetical protein